MTLNMSASGCCLGAETRLRVTVASGMPGGPLASPSRSGSRAPPGGGYKNLFPVVFSKYDVPPPFHSRKEKILLFIS